MTNNDNYIKIELVCYTESDKDKVLNFLYYPVDNRIAGGRVTWNYKCRQRNHVLDTLTSICERCNND